jgi:LPPG:FO 2-phospho-L-lactate transferase
MITFLSGGTGTPKLLRGMQKVVDRHEISVVVNTAEDIWISGNHISPDLDTVMYLFAGVLNTDTWWGLRDDTFISHEEVIRLGVEEFIAIGDRDRAVHIARAKMLKDGMRLTNITRNLCDRFGVRENVLPMTDTEVTTKVKTELGLIHYQDYWVRARGQMGIQEIVRTSKEPAKTTEEVLQAIEASDTIVIGPSNPITSISPILECDGIPSAIREKYVIAVSPFIGNAPVSGPAAALMKAVGFEATSKGTLDCYRDLVDLFIQDLRDPVEVPGAVRLDTLMTNEEKSLALAKEILQIINASEPPAFHDRG